MGVNERAQEEILSSTDLYSGSQRGHTVLAGQNETGLIETALFKEAVQTYNLPGL